MTQETIEATPEGQELTDVYYVIDLEIVEEKGRDLAGLLISRRCPSCAARIEEEGEIPAAKKQMGEIAKCCSSSEGFIRPGMSLLEMVFRLLLKAGSKPVALADLHYALTEDWARPTHPMNFSIDVLKRILDKDSYYGFKEVSGQAQKKGGRKARGKKK